jgi:hypothetical protein
MRDAGCENAAAGAHEHADYYSALDTSYVRSELLVCFEKSWNVYLVVPEGGNRMRWYCGRARRGRSQRRDEDGAAGQTGSRGRGVICPGGVSTAS